MTTKISKHNSTIITQSVSDTPHPQPLPEFREGSNSPPNHASAQVSSQLKKSRDWSSSPEIWKKLKLFVRELRKKPTISENHLWNFLKNSQRKNIKFADNTLLNASSLTFTLQSYI
jgi:hypothetical protein